MSGTPAPRRPSAIDPVEKLLLKLWDSRFDKAAIGSICKELLEVAPSNLQAVEMYLPQFAHIVIAVADDLPTVDPIEHLILAICQLSIHVALHFFWMVYTALLENRLKSAKSNRATYRRCAKLLLQLEQCVVYGGAIAVAGSPEGSDTTRQKELMSECARVASDVRHLSESRGKGEQAYTIAGTLRKKGGGESRCGRRTWGDKHFEIRDRILYYYNSQADSKDGDGDRPRGSLLLHTAVAEEKENPKYPHYFEVRNKQTGAKFCLQAPSREQMVKWIAAIRNASALPAPPGLSAKLEAKLLEETVMSEASETARPQLLAQRYSSLGKIAEEGGGEGEGGGSVDGGGGEGKQGARTRSLSTRVSAAKAAAVYVYFQSQREFIRALTNIAEELRFLPAAERQSSLQPKLDALLPLPPSTYFPLAHSNEPCKALLRITPDESIVFNTKARCPIMLTCEVRTEPFVLADLAEHVGSASPSAGDTSGGTNGGSIKEAEVTVVIDAQRKKMDFGAKKRETWADKEARLRASSPLAAQVREWELTSFIVKSNDDLRQEVFIMQMLRYFQSIWPSELTWINCYHIEATGPDTGLIQTITASSDLDRLKKADGYTSLRNLFISRYGDPASAGFRQAQDNFCRSLAGYSVAMWLLKLRDRHNGNLMLDDDGHFFHIDFGFCLGHSTGKGIGGLVECSAFKLTKEYIEVLDGVGSPVYEKFCRGCVAAMQACHAHKEAIVAMVEIVGTKSKFPCFQNSPVSAVVPALKKRLFFELTTDAQIDAAFRKLISTRAAAHWGSRRYDWFQNQQQGIAI